MKASEVIKSKHDIMGSDVSVPYGFLGEAGVYLPAQALSQLALKTEVPDDEAASLQHELRKLVPHSLVFADVPEDIAAAITTQRLLVSSVVELL